MISLIQTKRIHYLYSIFLVLVTAFISYSIAPQYTHPGNVALFFLLAIIFNVYRWDLHAAMVSACVAGALYIFIMSYTGNFHLKNTREISSLISMIIIGGVILQLTSKIWAQKNIAQLNAKKIAQIFDFTQVINLTLDKQHLLEQIAKSMNDFLQLPVAILMLEHNQLQLACRFPEETLFTPANLVAANKIWSLTANLKNHDQLIFDEGWNYLFLEVNNTKLALIAIDANHLPLSLSRDNHYCLHAMCNQAAIAIQHHQNHDAVREARIVMEKTNLQQALLSSLSHDLRTPLSVIKGVITSVIEYKDKYSEQARLELLTSALFEADKLNNYIGNLLNMIKLEANALTVAKKSVDVKPILEDAIARLQNKLLDYSIDIDLPHELREVYIDPVLTEQVLINVLDNAIKYSPPQSMIKIKIMEDNENFVIVKITDQGHGIPAQDLPHVFDLFYRVKMVDKEFGGTGLGLTICRGILEAQGGKITAESPGSNLGTTFTIYLPIDIRGDK